MNYANSYEKEGNNVLSVRLESHWAFILKLLICAALISSCLRQTLNCVGTIGFI